MKFFVTKILGLVGLVFLGACGGVVPENYRGEFVDVPSGTRLLLESSGGTLFFTTGRKIEASAKELSFSQLMTGEVGIYTRDSPKEPERLLEVFWISPKLNSRTEDEGHVWFESEVAVTQLLKSTSRPVGRVNFTYCENGKIQLDKPTQYWLIGCYEDARYFEFDRVQPRK